MQMKVIERHGDEECPDSGDDAAPDPAAPDGRDALDGGVEATGQARTLDPAVEDVDEVGADGAPHRRLV
jgi:hypothetical protein